MAENGQTQDDSVSPEIELPIGTHIREIVCKRVGDLLPTSERVFAVEVKEAAQAQLEQFGMVLPLVAVEDEGGRYIFTDDERREIAPDDLVVAFIVESRTK